MPLAEGAKPLIENVLLEKSQDIPEGGVFAKDLKGKKDILSAQDIKQSKDRINALRNSLPFFRSYQTDLNVDEQPLIKPTTVSKQKERPDEDEDEKEKCERSDTESIHEDIPPSRRNFVYNRIASYELPYKGSFGRNIRREKEGEEADVPRSIIACNEGYDPTEISRGKFQALKEKYQNSVSNLTYEGYDFESKNDFDSKRESLESGNASLSDSFKSKLGNKFPALKNDPASQDKLISKLKSDIEKLEFKRKDDSIGNVIVGNKDILNLLSSKHLANLNIRVERNPDFRRDKCPANRGKENPCAFRASRSGGRTSLRSSARKRKCRYKANNNILPSSEECRSKGNKNLLPSSEEKGTSDSTLKENESNSEDGLQERLQGSRLNRDDGKGSGGEYVKKKFPEYAKVNKRKGVVTGTHSDIPPRSLSTSPIEKAPIVKKICSSGVRLKKDSEPSLAANPVKKADSFRGSRVTRRNSFLYNTKGKCSKEGVDQDSFVKTQAVRLKRRSSKNAKKSEYRVSVTIRPSTVANLADKFNTIILQNQSENTTSQGDLAVSKISPTETKGPKYYSSPRASFKRKYRHKARALKETKGTERINREVEILKDSKAIDNAIYYSENLTTRKSLNNSLSELNMKDLFDDCDYNKTDEEKVCEKLKTALSSGKFKGETDDSEDDVASPKTPTADDDSDKQITLESPNGLTSTYPTQSQTEEIMSEEISGTNEYLTEKLNDNDKQPLSCNVEQDEPILETSGKLKETHFKNDSVDSGISTDESKTKDSSFSNDSSGEIAGCLEESSPSASDCKSLDLDLNAKDLTKDNEGYDSDPGEKVPLEVKCAEETCLFVDNLIYDKTDTLDIVESTSCKSKSQNVDSQIMKSGSEEQNKTVDDTVTKDKSNVDDLQSDCSSFIDDSYSEVSSICSDLKGKKSKGESRIYTSLKNVVKNTVKKTKEKDSERNDSEASLQKGSHEAREKKKWYKRGKSKERKSEQSSEIASEDTAKEKKTREGGRLYEKWTFRRFRDKSEDADKSKENPKGKKRKKNKKGKILSSDTEEEERSSLGVDTEGQEASSESETPKEELYGTVQFASRSRSREKRMAKEKRGYVKKMSIPENIPENVAEVTTENTSDNVPTENTENTSESDSVNKKVSENDEVCSKSDHVKNKDSKQTESVKLAEQKVSKGSLSVYEPHSPNGIKIIPPPPKTPIPSPPKQFKKFLFKHIPKGTRKDSDKNQSSSDKNSENPDNIYENICTPDVQDLKKNRKKLEEEGIKPINSFLWSESAIISTKATLAKSTAVTDDTTLDIIYGHCFKTKSDLNAPSKLTLSDNDEQSVRYDKIGSPVSTKKSSDDSNSEGHNYTEIQNNVSGDSQTISYDEIGAQSAVSYDEIAAPSSCGYDDIQAPSMQQEYDPFKSILEGYDPVNPPKSDSSNYDDCEGAGSMSHLEVVRHTQCHSHAYAYDDVSNYNVSQLSHSYEPVCPPDAAETVPYCTSGIPEFSSGNINVQGKGTMGQEDTKENMTEELIYGSDSSGNEPHEVFSYKLTRIGVSANGKQSSGTSSEMTSRPKSNNGVAKEDSAGQGSATNATSSTKIRKRKSRSSISHLQKEEDGKDMWEDVTDSEGECSIPLTLTTKFPILRREPNARRAPRYRITKKSWAQGIRDVAATHGNRVHTHSISSSLAKINPHAHGKAKITPTKFHQGHGRGTSADQVITCLWKQKRVDSDSECQSTGHYEAIYEVINPAEEEEEEVALVVEEDVKVETKEDEVKDDLKDDFQEDYPLDDPDLDDSFDSDDSDEAYSRLRPQFPEQKTSSLSKGSPSTLPAGLSLNDKYLRRKYNRSQSYQPHSINRIAEAANLGMKRLRRNWSLTKNEVRTGLNRIKKKSTFNMMDMKGTEEILSDISTTSGDKGKWSLKSRFRRKTSSGSAHTSSVATTEEGHQRDNATFYLTLTLAANGRDAEEGAECASSLSVKERRHSITPSVSSVTTTTSCETTSSAKPSTRPLSAPGTSLFRNSSSGSNSGALFRPTNPPPAPPAGVSSSAEVEEEEVDSSKDTLASRLNQLLSSGPVVPPGRRVLRTSECSSCDVSPVPLLPPSEDKTSLPRPPLVTLRGASSLRQLFPEGATSLNIPQTRSSVASSSSHGSSEGYIRPSDIASSPPPLPARPASSYPSLKRLSATSITPIQSQQQPPPPPRNVDGDSKSYLDLTYESNLTEEEPPYISTHFADEPLYQFYTAKVERAALYQGDSSEDDYEVINDGSLNTCTPKAGPRPTAMELVTPTDGRRTLWCELPEVVDSGILNKISNQERKLQEAMFEVITSEASYLKSLEVLVSHFMNCEELSDGEDPILCRRDKNVLFSDILPVKKCSELFLGDLEKRWQESFYISGITDIVLKHATSSFNVYVKYCSNQIYQDRKLRNLKEHNPRFVEVLTRLESSPVCQSLAMQSFLMLPMQRVTRLPLLIDAIFNRLEYGSSQWQECKVALASLQKIVAECNEAARKMERMEEMLLISHQLDFREVKAIPLISASRWLVKKGELTRLTWREGDAKLTFGRKISKHSLYFFLFTDLLVITKKKSDDQYTVLDFCPRNMVQVLELESADKFPGRILDGHKNLIIMTMLQNHENKTVEMVLSCPLESDRSRWMEAVTPRISENPDERIYEEWDCPQVQAIHSYVAKQPDELSLDVSDVFNVLRKTSDGWYQGERLRDGARGWFPGNHTAEIASAHVRARNLRQRYRLLAISGSIVDELKKEKERYEKEEKKKDRRRTLTIKEVL